MKENYPLHIFLFLVTVLTTMLAGAELVTGKMFVTGDLGPRDIFLGLEYSVAFLTFLTFHEFGHYFTALYHKVKCSLPFYIPIFIPFSIINIGSFGAVIRIREVPQSRKKYFDIGVAGPLAGFVISILLLVIGFSTLPDAATRILEIHPDYQVLFGGLPTETELVDKMGGVFKLGDNLLFSLFKNYWPVGEGNMPPDFEMMHYPLLFVGFITLFFTALNMLPIGQLDGGHVVYGLFGAKKAKIISRLAVFALLLIGGTGVMHFHTYDPLIDGSFWEYLSWEGGTTLAYFGLVFTAFSKIFDKLKMPQVLALVFGMLSLQALACLIFPLLVSKPIWLLYAFMTTRMVGLDHPVAIDDSPLSGRQKILGWLAILIFVICFSLDPLLFVVK